MTWFPVKLTRLSIRRLARPETAIFMQACCRRPCLRATAAARRKAPLRLKIACRRQTKTPLGSFRLQPERTSLRSHANHHPVTGPLGTIVQRLTQRRIHTAQRQIVTLGHFVARHLIDAQGNQNGVMAIRQTPHGALKSLEIGARFGDHIRAGSVVHQIIHFHAVVVCMLPGTAAAQTIHCGIAGNAIDVGFMALQSRDLSHVPEPDPGIVQAFAGQIAATEMTREPAMQLTVVGDEKILQCGTFHSSLQRRARRFIAGSHSQVFEDIQFHGSRSLNSFTTARARKNRRIDVHPLAFTFRERTMGCSAAVQRSPRNCRRSSLVRRSQPLASKFWPLPTSCTGLDASYRTALAGTALGAVAGTAPSPAASLPKPSTRTVKIDGKAWRASLRARCTESCASVAAELAAALALVNAPTLTAAIVGMPTASPLTWMLAALITCSAARLTLPETRMPASPASMVPSGAIRSTSPGGTSGSGASVAMPAPLLGTFGDTLTLPTVSYSRLGGVYTSVVLEPRPALMSPLADHTRMSPPKLVITRDSPSNTLSCA